MKISPRRGPAPPHCVVFSFGARNAGFDNVVNLATGLKEIHRLNSYIDSEYLPKEAGSYLISGNEYTQCQLEGMAQAGHARRAVMIFIVTPEWLASTFARRN